MTQRGTLYCINESSTRHCKNLRTRSDWPWGPTRPPVQWVPGLCPGDKAAGAWLLPPTLIYGQGNGETDICHYYPSGTSWPVTYICNVKYHCFFQVLREILGPETRRAITFMIQSHFYVVYFTALSVTQALLTCMVR